MPHSSRETTQQYSYTMPDSGDLFFLHGLELLFTVTHILNDISRQFLDESIVIHITNTWEKDEHLFKTNTACISATTVINGTL